MIKNLTQITTAVSVLLLPLAAFSEGGGREIGNGGNSIVCETSNTAGEKTKSAYMLDLYEGRVLYNLETITETGALPEKELAEQTVSKLETLDQTYAALVRHELENVIQKINLLPPGEGITPIPDSFHVSYPKHCDIKQLANYTKEHGILIDQDIWNLLDPIHRAALFVHEAVYKVERDLFGATNSIHARKIVAYLFSQTGLTPELWKEKIRPLALLQFDGVDRFFGQFGTTSGNVTLSFILRNAGNGTSSKIAITLTSPSSKIWVLHREHDGCSGNTLETGETCVFRITFLAGTNGQTAGFYKADLRATAIVGGTITRIVSGTSKYAWTGSTYHWSHRLFDDTTFVQPGSPCATKGGSFYQYVTTVPAGTQSLYRRNSQGDGLCPGQWYYQIPTNDPRNNASGFLRECNKDGVTWQSNQGATSPGHFNVAYLCAPVGSAEILWADGRDEMATPGSCMNENTYIIKQYSCL